MTHTFEAEMHVTFEDRALPVRFPVVVVAQTADDVVKLGPALMLARYNADGWQARKVEFFAVRLRERVELVIP
jgi:hypothetical protein